ACSCSGFGLRLTVFSGFHVEGYLCELDCHVSSLMGSESGQSRYQETGQSSCRQPAILIVV
ncbi:MAG: hypothetical protein K0U59_10165, partial [Gammaproteobacteria bacterium]|nr:hypothetical protein [Gammaproteobacteria bacterium]